MDKDINMVSALSADLVGHLPALLAMMPPPARALHVLEHFGPAAVTELWRTDDGQSLSPSAFAASLSMLAQLASTPVGDKPQAIEHLLLLVGGPAFRRAPPILMLRLLRHIEKRHGDRRLAELSVVAIARWATSIEAPPVTFLSKAPLSAMLTRALHWRPNDELALRRHPEWWPDPASGVAIAGFHLTPLTTTCQMLSAIGTPFHQALCSMMRRDAMKAGAEAWWAIRNGRSEGIAGYAGILRDAARPDVWRPLNAGETAEWIKKVAARLAEQATQNARARKFQSMASAYSDLEALQRLTRSLHDLLSPQRKRSPQASGSVH